MFELLFDPSSPIVWILILSILASAIAIISRPFSTYVKFVYPNAKFEAMGNPYIQKNRLEKLTESETLDQFIEQINSDKDYTIQASTALEIQQSLDNHLYQIIQQMKQDNAKKMHSFYNTIIEQKNASILKEILRNIQQKKTIEYERLIKQTTAPKITQFITTIQNASEESIKEHLKTYGFNETLSTLATSHDTVPLQLDAAVDSYFISLLETVKVPYKCQEAKHEYIARLTDIISIQHLIRAKHMEYHEKLCELLYIANGYEIPTWKFQELCKTETVSEMLESLEGTSYYQPLKQAYDKEDISKSVQSLTTALDKHVLTLLKHISQQHYGNMGPTLRFLISKEAEITNLKIISKGISEQLKPEQIKPLLITEVTL